MANKSEFYADKNTVLEFLETFSQQEYSFSQDGSKVENGYTGASVRNGIEDLPEPIDDSEWCGQIIETLPGTYRIELYIYRPHGGKRTQV